MSKPLELSRAEAKQWIKQALVSPSLDLLAKLVSITTDLPVKVDDGFGNNSDTYQQGVPID